MSGERALEGGEHLRREIEEILGEEMQAPGDLVLDGRLLEMQFAGEPQELDLIADGADAAGALAIGPARGFEILQQQIDLAILLEDGDALGLGRMGGDDRANAQRFKLRANLVRGDAGLGGVSQNMREGAEQFVAALGALYGAAAAHGRGLLGDGEQLKPYALRLQSPRHERRRHSGGGAEAAQNGCDLGLMALHHAHELIEKKGRRLFDRSRRQRRRGGGRGRFGQALLVGGHAVSLAMVRRMGASPRGAGRGECRVTRASARRRRRSRTRPGSAPRRVHRTS
jgi:hypothetical protein